MATIPKALAPAISAIKNVSFQRRRRGRNSTENKATVNSPVKEINMYITHSAVGALLIRPTKPPPLVLILKNRETSVNKFKPDRQPYEEK